VLVALIQVGAMRHDRPHQGRTARRIGQVTEDIDGLLKSLDLQPPILGIKKMKTKWGTCNPTKCRVWLNLELAKKPRRCVEYPFGDLYRILLMTGQRRGEVAEMRWSEIGFEMATWTIPAHRAKNGLAHDVPLSAPVMDILNRIPRFVGSDFVFTTTGTTPISGFGRAKQRIEAAVGADDWWV